MNHCCDYVFYQPFIFIGCGIESPVDRAFDKMSKSSLDNFFLLFFISIIYLNRNILDSQLKSKWDLNDSIPAKIHHKNSDKPFLKFLTIVLVQSLTLLISNLRAILLTTPIGNSRAEDKYVKT